MAAVAELRCSEEKKALQERTEKRAKAGAIWEQEEPALLRLVHAALGVRLTAADGIPVEQFDSENPYDWLPTVTIEGMRFGRRTQRTREPKDEEFLTLSISCQKCACWFTVNSEMRVRGILELGLALQYLNSVRDGLCTECYRKRDY